MWISVFTGCKIVPAVLFFLHFRILCNFIITCCIHIHSMPYLKPPTYTACIFQCSRLWSHLQCRWCEAAKCMLYVCECEWAVCIEGMMWHEFQCLHKRLESKKYNQICVMVCSLLRIGRLLSSIFSWFLVFHVQHHRSTSRAERRKEQQKNKIKNNQNP